MISGQRKTPLGMSQPETFLTVGRHPSTPTATTTRPDLRTADVRPSEARNLASRVTAQHTPTARPDLRAADVRPSEARNSVSRVSVQRTPGERKSRQSEQSHSDSGQRVSRLFDQRISDEQLKSRLSDHQVSDSRNPETQSLGHRGSNGRLHQIRTQDPKRTEQKISDQRRLNLRIDDSRIYSPHLSAQDKVNSEPHICDLRISDHRSSDLRNSDKRNSDSSIYERLSALRNNDGSSVVQRTSDQHNSDSISYEPRSTDSRNSDLRICEQRHSDVRTCEQRLSDPRLSPRVMVDVDLSFVKPKLGNTSTVVNQFLQTRTPTPSPLLSDSDTSTSREGEGAAAKKDCHVKVAQLNAYVAWVNSQLKKRHGCRLIEDLRVDMRDGSALLHLIEIVGGEKLPGTHVDPSGYSDMKDNVEKVLQFMCKNRIKMHRTNATDIVDGNLKAIMRLILALAAHYKPNSVKHSSHHQHRSPSKGSNIAGIAQGASAALADARRHAARAGHRYRRSRDAAINERRKRQSPEYSELSSKMYQESSSDQFSESDECYRPTSRSRVRHSRREVEGSSSPNTIYGSPRSSLNKLSSRDNLICHSKSADYVTAKDSGAELEDTMTMIDKTQYEELLTDYTELAIAMKETRHELSKLQDVLLTGKTVEEGGTDNFDGTSPQERIAVLRSKLLQQSELSEDLRSELSKSKNECMQLQGMKAGLQHRLCEQNISLSALKSELLQKDFEKQNLEAEKTSLLKQLSERDKLILDIRKDILKRDNKIDNLQHDLLLKIQEKESTTRCLKSQIQDLHNRLRVVGDTGATLSARVATQDKRMAKLEGKIFHPPLDNGSPIGNSGPEELNTVREALQQLRLQYEPTEPQQKSVDTLERSIASLLEHLYSFSNCTTPVNRSNISSSVESSPKRVNYDKASDVRRSSTSSASGDCLGVSQLDSLPPEQVCTKVLYFTDKMVTPFMCTIYKKLGEITLKDFKELFEKPEQFRYHFKALDPEYGTVKEEISNDETVIPGWEGKIVAWIEEEQATPC